MESDLVRVAIGGVDARGARAWVGWAERTVVEMARQLGEGRRSMMVLPSEEVRVETWRLLSSVKDQADEALVAGETTFTLRYEFDMAALLTVMRTHARFNAFLLDLIASGELSSVPPPEAAATADYVNGKLGAELGLLPNEIPRLSR